MWANIVACDEGTEPGSGFEARFDAKGQYAAVTRQHPALRRREAIATARIVFRCKATLYDSIKAVADRNRLSMSESVRMMITTYLGNDGGRSRDLTRLAKSLRPLSRIGGTTFRSRKALR
jgi:hypothetical protein